MEMLGSQELLLKDGVDPLSAVLNFEAKTFLPGLLAVEDRLSMAHGLEVRVPFLDNDLVDFCQALPRRSRLAQTPPKQADIRVGRENATGKQLLRQAMKGALPDDTLRATKQGFSGPDTKWFAQDLSDDVSFCLKSFDPEVADASVVADLLINSDESSVSARLLSWSLVASSMHLRDYWPSFK
jgi:asparagine synthase (glutamine-hydrolysing)